LASLAQARQFQQLQSQEILFVLVSSVQASRRRIGQERGNKGIS